MTEKEELDMYKAAFHEVARVCASASKGNLEPRLLRKGVTGELGTMFDDVNQLLDLTDAFVRESGAALEHAGEGKFFRRVIQRGMHGSFRRGAATINSATDQMKWQSDQLAQAERQRLDLAEDFENSIAEVVDSIASAATEMHATAGALTDAASRTDVECRSAAAAAAESAEDAQTVASAVEELSITSNSISSQVDQSSGIMREAEKASEGTRLSMTDLSEASTQIDRVLKLIHQVAQQTNLLALNATIEAARAGEAGKGFAVVASEVKGLANQTAAATTEISDQIDAIQRASVAMAKAIEATNEQIGGMSSVSEETTRTVAEQGLATQEIAGSVHRVSDRASEISEHVAEVQKSSSETMAAASELQGAATELSRQSEALSASSKELLVGLKG